MVGGISKYSQKPIATLQEATYNKSQKVRAILSQNFTYIALDYRAIIILNMCMLILKEKLSYYLIFKIIKVRTIC